METHPQSLTPPLKHCLQSDRSLPIAGLPTPETFKTILHSQDFANSRYEDRPFSRATFDRMFKTPQRSGNCHSPVAETRSDPLPNEGLFSVSTRPGILVRRDLDTFHPQAILTYQDRIVAAEDLLYDILCFCHLASDHGDQCATNALVQDLHAFVSSVLVGEFVDSCPACAEKSLKKASEAAPTHDDYVFDEEEPGRRDNTPVYDSSSNPASTSTSSDPLFSSETSKPEPLMTIRVDGNEEDDSMKYHRLKRTLRNPLTEVELPLMPTRSDPGFRPSSSPSLGAIERVTSLPMSREVSLYQGIPNGWQYHFPDYESALNKFVKQKDGPLASPSPIEGLPSKMKGLPRVPSIAPLRGDKIQNTLGNGSELFDRRLSASGHKDVMKETPRNDLMNLALAQIDEFSVSHEICKENDIQV
ncbi:hypothetical protein L218DRAFT_185392 [Marasmius fiardii PR-910]|nr:hypothetical protein L218DRAFT_185392 [Marasmius fiardii PR-910]